MENIFICEKCDKTYSSKNSLLNHKRIYHLNEQDKKRNKNITDNKYYCRHCDNKYNNRKTRWAHEQRCVLETAQERLNKLITENAVIKQENANLKTDVKQKSVIIRLHKKLETANDRNYKTFTSLNKALKERSIQNQINNINITNNNSNNTNNNSNNTNNNTNNIQQICNLGEEDIKSLTTFIQKLKTVTSGYMSMDNLIEMTYCGKDPQCRIIRETNRRNT